MTRKPTPKGTAGPSVVPGFVSPTASARPSRARAGSVWRQTDVLSPFRGSRAPVPCWEEAPTSLGHRQPQKKNIYVWIQTVKPNAVHFEGQSGIGFRLR